MEIKSRVTRFAGLLCIAGALQGFPVIYSANPGGIISVARQGTYHLTGTDCGWDTEEPVTEPM